MFDLNHDKLNTDTFYGPLRVHNGDSLCFPVGYLANTGNKKSRMTVILPVTQIYHV